jgi:hypothetical protein
MMRYETNIGKFLADSHEAFRAFTANTPAITTAVWAGDTIPAGTVSVASGVYREIPISRMQEAEETLRQQGW